MTELDRAIDRLAHLPPSPNPVISCFVNTGPDGRGRPTFMTFLKKAFSERLRSFPERADAVRHIEADRDRILAYLSGELDPSVKAASIHASDADGLWEAHTFRTPFDEERLVVGPVPHLYPLVKLADQSPLYAVCVADTRQARLVVCGLGEVLTEEDFAGPEPIDRTRVAGWAEIRYQSRIEDHIQKNAREIVERLAKIVDKGEVDYVILGGDEPILGELRRYITPAIREKLIDEEHISIDDAAHEILKRTLQVVRDTEARDSRRLADTVIDRFRAGGLAVAGLEPTIAALNLEQVDQLLLAESFNGNHAGWQCAQCRVLGSGPAPEACPFCEEPMPERVELREAMVRRAERTGRKIEIVESHAGLEALDGVGALLRYRV
ncbi:MAG TPA: Vms1/Ankzf1 family peptidyl-tRNA hydrolase [Gemmatimonadota bacterium]|nr:Vms1/Ankzf1 family peptidyl-tRNA hydrolase [Gemmatimonadota bacterium]